MKNNWPKAKLSDTISFEKGKMPHKLVEGKNGDYIPYINIKAFEKRIFSQFTDGRNCTISNDKDVLIVWDGARCGLVGKGLHGAVGSTLARLFSSSIHHNFLYYFLQSQFHTINSNPRGIGIPHINPGVFWNIEIPVPPISTQQQIVAKIDELFSQLDAAEAALKRARANLKRYRQSVLQAAVTGELTREWRESHMGEIEPASELLRRIEPKRKNDNWEEFFLNQNNAITLPDGWAICKSGSLFDFVTSGSRGWAQYYSDSGAIFLRIGNLNHDTIDLNLHKIQFVNVPTSSEGLRTRVKENDILISITADVGMIGIVPSDIEEAYINQHISLARPSKYINAKYLAWYLASEIGLKQFKGLQRGATKVGLGLDDIKKIMVLLPSLVEQEVIVALVDEAFSQINSLEEQINKNYQRISHLRQSILHQAFSGKLLPQDIQK